MLTNREKKMLYILAVVVVVTGCGLFFFLRWDALKNIEDQIEQTTLNIQRILTDTPDEEALKAAIEELDGKIIQEKNKFYKPGSIDLSTFSNNVMGLIRENNLKVIKVQNESKPNSQYVYFQLEGNAYGLARVLKQISEADKYWSVLEINVDNKRHDGIRDGKDVAITMRIIYEVDSNNAN